ncbi:MAG: transketolase [Pirellulaceae bacterium]
MGDSVDELSLTARRIRARLVKMSHDGKAPHLGSALSCVDILVALYWAAAKIDVRQPARPDRDRILLSKGHAAAALYAVLAERGYWDPGLLETYAGDGSQLPEQMSPGCVPGVEAATGSLGHGLSLGTGMALAGRIQQCPYRVWVVLSDGECNEGSVWEAAMFTAAQQLGPVTAIIDYNRWQATGRSDEVLQLQPLDDKWRAFGWEASVVDGHDLSALIAALDPARSSPTAPRALIARTVKGKGVSFMEDDNNWHYRIPSEEEVRRACAELEVS